MEARHTECYFDNSATTKPLKSVVDEMVLALTENYGNPSSLHRVGDAALEKLNESRDTIAKALCCDSSEIYFTSGGTESNNIAIFGAAHALKRRGNRIVTTCVEHPSVLECMTRLSLEGFEVIKLPVDEKGHVLKTDLEDAINEQTILVSMMYVNNEVGAIEPIDEVAKIIKRKNSPALFHVDAVQAFGKLSIRPSSLGIDLLSVSSHKVHGPKGQGALYMKKGTRLVPYVLGGGQEGNVRSGTQGMPGIVGFAAAIKDISDIESNTEYVQKLKEQLLDELKGESNLIVNSLSEFSYILNISLLGVPSEVLRNFLSELGVYVSTGSACSKGHRSYVLTAMGLEPKVIDSAIRISFSRFNTEEEVKYLADCLKRANKSLRKV